MYKHLIICNILFISFTLGEVIPVSKVSDTNPTLNKITSVSKDTVNHTLITEGGAITSNNSVTLPKENHTLINIDKELTISKPKSVVPRKGVKYDAADDISKSGHLSDESSSTIKNQNNLISKVTLVTPTSDNTTSVSNGTEKLNVTKILKPLVLSHESLAKMDEINHVHIEEDEPDVKVQVMKAGSHPGLIIPIVITILVVPMFAVVAYLALKRGKEAWKNRHYKRMDFLLDGMYND
ncbi:unnamed protein product [Danaus chrysippus]|uniref:(African queen) hypothetical protein n=1 Tax=Danaus chrysippus TaxID=151541 RepID=A0A8J2QQD3_9NEOP|nr:unnamed protein product [Danaus chrysippus]